MNNRMFHVDAADIGPVLNIMFGHDQRISAFQIYDLISQANSFSKIMKWATDLRQD